MTTWTGPLKVKLLNAETTVAQIDVSGTATFPGLIAEGNVSVSGNIQILEGSLKIMDAGASVTAAVVDVSGTANFRGMQLVTQATLHTINSGANPVTFSLPTGANLVEAYVDLEIPFATGSVVTAHRVNLNLAGSADAPLAEIGVSASGRYDFLGVMARATQLRNITATVEAFTSSKSTTTATDTGQAMLTLVYTRP